MNTALLQKAVHLHKSKQYVDAEKAYLQLLAKNKNDVNANQLYGALLTERGDFAKAIKYLQSSIKLNPRQAHVLQNLMLCQKQLGLFAKALDTCHVLSNMLGKNTMLLKFKIDLLVRTDRLSQARQEISGSALTAEERISLKKALAKSLKDNDKYVDAIEEYVSAQKLSPQDPEINHDLALTYRLAGQSEQALPIYKKLLDDGIKSHILYHNFANALSDLGMLLEAKKYYQSSIELKPDHVDAHINLNDILWELGEQEAFLLSYKSAIQKGYISKSLYKAYISALVKTGQFELAKSTLESIGNDLAKSADFIILRGRVLKKLSGVTKAIHEQSKIKQSPDCKIEHELELIESLIQGKDFTAANTSIQSVLQQEPDNRLALAYLSICIRTLDIDYPVQQFDYDNLVRAYELATFVSAEYSKDFFAELTNYLVSLHTTKVNPLEQTLRGGTQTRGNLFNDTHPLIHKVKNAVTQCINDYIGECAQALGRGLNGNNPTIEFTGSWSVRLKSSGFHTSHMHPMGTISSVLYVSLPDIVQQENDEQGWLTFGSPKDTLETKLTPTRTIQPAVGKLVLFPSYFWHATIPFESEQNRITIAFDVRF